MRDTYISIFFFIFLLLLLLFVFNARSEENIQVYKYEVRINNKLHYEYFILIGNEKELLLNSLLCQYGIEVYFDLLRNNNKWELYSIDTRYNVNDLIHNFKLTINDEDFPFELQRIMYALNYRDLDLWVISNQKITGTIVIVYNLKYAEDETFYQRKATILRRYFNEK